LIFPRQDKIRTILRLNGALVIQIRAIQQPCTNSLIVSAGKVKDIIVSSGNDRCQEQSFMSLPMVYAFEPIIPLLLPALATSYGGGFRERLALELPLALPLI